MDSSNGATLTSSLNSTDSFATHLAGMSKNQLYDVMLQMKALIDQNKGQARQILVQNPSLTKILFQAQIMLGMVEAPRIPNIQQALSQQAPPAQPQNVPATSPPPTQAGVPLKSGSQAPNLNWQTPVQMSMPFSTATAPLANQQLQFPAQVQSHFNVTAGFQSSQVNNVPMVPLNSVSHAPILPPPLSTAQQPLVNPGVLPQPPLSQQLRPSMQPFQHLMHSQTSASYTYQPSNVSQQHPPQSTYAVPLQPPLPSQPPPMSLHQVGSLAGTGLNNQGPNQMQVERGSSLSWFPNSAESSATVQIPGPPQIVPGQTGMPGQSSRLPQLSPEEEQLLLQQVRNLTPEQINLLPPEHRNQVLQLQQMLL